jgi:succinate dehydrogenase / fumarate reductase iron-sulfur subunit
LNLRLVPQGRPERDSRARKILGRMDQKLFGSCTNVGACEAVCPKSIQLEVIARMNRDYIKAAWTHRGEAARAEGG